MKKIKNEKQLRKEKKLLRQREKELLRKINSGWQHLKGSLHPQNFIKEQVSCKGKNPGTANEENIFKSILSFGATLLVKKIIKRTEERLEKVFN
jgi:ABC-type dipeptide/oligopeptide/nickel transport system ATPase subunit